METRKNVIDIGGKIFVETRIRAIDKRKSNFLSPKIGLRMFPFFLHKIDTKS